ncbi:MAG: 30S ribosomal protein S20 [Chloroflexota bacterium]
MANTKSALKRIRVSEKRRLRNREVRSETRTYVRRARVSIENNPAGSTADITRAVSALDRAARKGVIHPNNAARRKSRLMRRLNARQHATQ